MNRHDPYGPMLEELRRQNDADTEDAFHDCLQQAQPYVTTLRQAYKQSPSNVDFSCPHTRAAYLLTYYTNYIEPIYEILSQLPSEVIKSSFGYEKLRGLFLGAGPAPEVLGWVAFLEDHAQQVKSVTAYLLDKYIHGWRTGQEITRYHLAPYYWTKGQLTTRPMEFDFLEPTTLDDPFVDRAIQISDMVVMQNCLNDQLGNRQAVLTMVHNIFTQTKPGTLFIICDLNYGTIRDLIREIGNTIENSGRGQVILPVHDQATRLCSNVEVPQIIREHLLIGDETRNLIPRKYTQYYATVLQRMEEVPF